MTPAETRALIERLRELMEAHHESEFEPMSYDDVAAACTALEATLAPVAGEPTAWIATGPNGRVLHFAKEDGWTVDAVMHEPLPPLAPQANAPAAGEDGDVQWLVTMAGVESQPSAWGERLRNIAARLAAQAREIAALESLRPFWAQGHSSDSIAAQVTTAALAQIWEFLGVKNQTAAMQKLAELRARAEAAEKDARRYRLLREPSNGYSVSFIELEDDQVEVEYSYHGDALDARVDAALATNATSAAAIAEGKHEA